MRVKLDLDESNLKYRFAGNIEEAQAWLDNEVIADTDPYVPMDTGMLATAPLKNSTRVRLRTTNLIQPLNIMVGQERVRTNIHKLQRSGSNHRRL